MSNQIKDEHKSSFIKSFSNIYNSIYTPQYNNRPRKTERIRCMNNITNSIKRLVSDTILNGGDINERNEYGLNALMLVFIHCVSVSEKMDNIHFNNACNIAEFLVNNGVDVNAQDDTKRTSLMHVCELQYPDDIKAIQLLIDLKADLNLQDKNGWTALHYASTFAYDKEIIDLLIDSGADTNIKDKNGNDFICEMKPGLIENLYRDSIRKIKKIQSVKTCINEGYKAQDAIIISYLNESSAHDDPV
jgi:ankyrin repeat protein